MSIAKGLIDNIKKHGAELGLEAELSARLTQVKACVDKKEWAYCRSHALMIADLAEELRKLGETK